MMMEGDDGETVTVATGTGLTVTLAVPDFPSLAAEIVTLPVTSPVTRPLGDTVAVAELEVLHVTVRPVNAALLASRVSAVNCWVVPTVRLAMDGDTLTLATGTGMTVSVACPDLVPAAAVMVVCPAATAVIAPPVEIVATVGDDDDHVRVPVDMGAAFWSAPAAVAVAVCPI